MQMCANLGSPIHVNDVKTCDEAKMFLLEGFDTTKSVVNISMIPCALLEQKRSKEQIWRTLPVPILGPVKSKKGQN